MKLFYVTLPKSKARRILEGKLRLADVKLPRKYTEGSPDTVELHDDFEPPMKPDTEVVLKIRIPKSKRELTPYIIPVCDSPENIFEVPRSWLDGAVCEILTNGGILKHCTRHLNSMILPDGPMLLELIQKCVDSGKTKYLSPFYIQALHRTQGAKP